MMTRPRVVLIVALAALAARTAAADPLDEVGFGAAATGLASSNTASAIGAAAIHLDPAAVALADRPELLVGYQSSLLHLTLDDHDAGVTDARGTTVGLALPFAVRGVRVGAGVALYLPDQFLARILIRPITEPQFIRLETAAQRIAVEPVAAIAFGDFAIGAGASLLADARSRRLAFDVGSIGGTTQGNADLDVALPLRAAPLVSARWTPSPWVELSAMYRGQLSIDVALDIDAHVNVPGVVTGDALIALSSTSFFTPMRVGVAAAIHPRDDLVVTADLAWERWSALGSASPDLSVLLALDIAPPLVSAMQPPARFSNTITPRLGAQWQTGELQLRTGLAYLPSPVPPQTGITSYADGARLLATAGGGIRIPASTTWTRPIDLDLGFAWQHVDHELVHKDPAIYPGGSFASGGNIVEATISSTVRF